MSITEQIEKGIVNFIFGDHSQFNALCYDMVTELQAQYPMIRRIHYRTNYEECDDRTMQYLISGYEQSLCPSGIGKAGRASYAKRNEAMINASDVCVFYYDEIYVPCRAKNSPFARQSKSGTAVAYAYALRKKKQIYNLF